MTDGKGRIEMSEMTPEERAIYLVSYMNYQGHLPDGVVRMAIAEQICAAVEAERERCAGVAHHLATMFYGENIADRITAAIRAEEETK